MELQEYQKEAINKICETMETVGSPNKLRVEISTGLGRNMIMTALAQKCYNKGDKVMILSPNRTFCAQLKSEICTDETKKIPNIVMYISEYKNADILITTYSDLKRNSKFMLKEFKVVICDGIHYLERKIIEKRWENTETCIIGFTSQVDGKVTGYFEDAKCVFRYTLQEALKDGYIIKYRELDSIVWEIFRKQGYEVKISDCINEAYDMRADKGNEHLIIEVKNWFQGAVSNSVLRKTVEQLLYAAQGEKGDPVLVTVYPYPEEIKKRLPQSEKIRVIDIQKLLDMTQGDTDLENRLQAALNYSLDEMQSAKQSSAKVSRDKKIESLIRKIETWEPRENSFTRYEEVCVDVLKCLFSEDLELWRKQETSNDKLFRFDLVCKIHNGNQKEFWQIAERYFNSKYIVFEFKNYEGEIGQKEVVITEKYLYQKALRKVAILISTNGADENAEKMIHGILREEGKLILSLSNLDLLNMLRKKMDNEDPAQYLSEKLDELLLDLEK